MKLAKGSIALISLLIISALAIIIVLGASDLTLNSLYYNSDNFSAYNTKYIAEACLEEAIVRLESDTSFNSGAITFDNDSNCQIIISAGPTYTINITANYLNAVENYRATIEITTSGLANNANLINWREI